MKRLLLAIFFVFCQPCWAGVTFDAADDVITFASTADIIREDRALTLYIRGTINGLGEGSIGALITRPTSSGLTACTIRVAATNALRFGWVGTTSLARLTNNDVYIFGVPSVFIFTWDGSTTAANVHIYVNGIEATYATTTNGVALRDTADATTYIANNLNSDATADATYQEIALWSRVLNAGEIAYLSNDTARDKPPDKIATNLELYYRIDDGVAGTSADGDSFADTSGNGITGTGSDGANNTGHLWTAETILMDKAFQSGSMETKSGAMSIKY